MPAESVLSMSPTWNLQDMSFIYRSARKYFDWVQKLAFYQYMVCIFRMHIFLHKIWKKWFFQNDAEKSASGKTENSRSCAGKSANYIQIRNLNNLCIKRILNLWLIFHMFTYFKPYNLIWMCMTLQKNFQENNIKAWKVCANMYKIYFVLSILMKLKIKMLFCVLLHL